MWKPVYHLRKGTKYMSKNKNKNVFNGKTNFYGPVQISQHDIINTETVPPTKKAYYKPEPKWRSPFTLGVLAWIGLVLSIISFFQMREITFPMTVSVFSGMFRGIKNQTSHDIMNLNLIVSCILILLLAFTFKMLIFTIKQIRIPLAFNFAVNGYGRRITIEKIHPGKCPICGGKMKYYYKPILSTNTGIFEIALQKTPVLECTRNSKHCFPVDPAESKI